MSRGELAEFDETNFDGMVLERPGLTVVDFWSSTCAPCRQLTKILSQLQPDLRLFIYYKVLKKEK